MKKVVKEKTVLPETAGTPRRGRAVSLRAFYSLAVLLALVFCLARLVGPSCASAKTLGAVQSRVRENCGSAARQKFRNTVRPAQQEHLTLIGQIQWQATTRTHITSGSAGGATAIPARRIEIPSTFQQLVIYPIHPTASHFGRDPPVQLTLNPRYDRSTRYAAAASAFVAAENPVTEEGIQQIEQHLARPELNALNDPANQAMIARLRAGSTTPQDLNFYNHELYEKGLMDTGISARDAHMQTLQWQGIPYEPGYEAQLYHPSVIQQFPEYFNPAAYPQH